jgi:hypothetical protein
LNIERLLEDQRARHGSASLRDRDRRRAGEAQTPDVDTEETLVVILVVGSLFSQRVQIRDNGLIDLVELIGIEPTTPENSSFCPVVAELPTSSCR